MPTSLIRTPAKPIRRILPGELPTPRQLEIAMSSYHVSLTLLLAGLTGCHSFGPLKKRESELNCPTDIRQTVPWCAGEDAIFRCPCGPTSDFYGHKPTCWRTWPAPAAVWRDAHCSCLNTAVVEGGDSEAIMLPPVESSPEPVQAIEATPSASDLPPSTSAAPRQRAGSRQNASAGRSPQLRKTPVQGGATPASFAAMPQQPVAAYYTPPVAGPPEALGGYVAPSNIQELADVAVELPQVEGEPPQHGSSSAFLEAVGRATSPTP